MTVPPVGSARARLLGVALLSAVMVGIASPAHAAADADDGQWWYDVYGVEQAHADGWTGEGVKIAVIDSQINPDLPVFADADLTVAPGASCEGAVPATSELNDSSRHGSTVAALLVGNGAGAGAIRGIVPDASVTFYGTGPLEQCADGAEAQAAGLSAMLFQIERALDDGAQIISISQGGGAEGLRGTEVIARAVAEGVPIVASVPNRSSEGGGVPNGFRGTVAVNAVDRDANLLIGDLGVPNANPWTTVVAPGSPFSSIGAPGGTWDDSNRTAGSSLATPLVSGILVAAMQKYPDASANQLLQSLIHNTGTEPHELAYDGENGFGYGVASLRSVLAADPSVYDDVNPLLDKPLAQLPTDEEFAAAEASVSASPTPTPSSDGAPEDAGDGSPFGTIIVILAVVGGLVIVGAIILTIVLVRRSKNHAKEQS